MIPRKGYFIIALVGVAAIAIALTAAGQALSLQIQRSPNIAVVTIPQGSSTMFDGEGTFEPRTSTVVIGVNNTVSWINHDNGVAFIEADNDRVDPAFYKATTLPEGVVTTIDGEMTSTTSDIGSLDLPNILEPGESFEYTFTIPGEYGFHSKPWQRGTIIVLSPEGVR